MISFYIKFLLHLYRNDVGIIILLIYLFLIITFFKIYLFYLFIFGRVGSSLLLTGFL